MSKLYEPAYADPHYALIRPAGGRGVTLAAGPGTPSGLSLPASGYAPGCIFQNDTNPTVLGTIVYVNTGDATTAVWTNIL